ncbi:unnamed protein product [Schistosoma mattheei]|nr:unnamed protein product [Schistosoma mattheei]
MKGGFYGLAAKTFLSVTNTQLWCIAAANSRLLNDKNNTDLSTDHYLSNTEIRTQAQKLAARLKDLQRHQEAIQIYIDFLEDPVMAIRTACEDRLWMDARRLVMLHILLNNMFLTKYLFCCIKWYNLFYKILKYHA